MTTDLRHARPETILILPCFCETLKQPYHQTPTRTSVQIAMLAPLDPHTRRQSSNSTRKLNTVKDAELESVEPVFKRG